ncbi:MAG TPA: hypothetical protein VIL25_02790 [Vicinamibacterales bacterium]
MERRRSAWRALVVGCLALLVGCSSPPEEKILQDFFRAARMRDDTTLGNIATVSFNPGTDGVVQRFEVVEIGEERRRPLPLREYAEALERARAADAEFTERKRAYQTANLAAIDRIMKAEAANRSIAPADRAVKAAWDKWVADTAVHTKAVSDAQYQLNANTGIAELSLARAGAAVDVRQLDGELISKDVRIRATVRPPEGSPVERSYRVRMQRVEMKDSQGQTLSGRWIVTSIEPEET